MVKKSILITGAGSGLGFHASLALARRGHKVYATTEFEEQTKTLSDISNSENLNLISFKLDITNEDDRNKINKIDFDVLINNAAIGDSGSVCEIDVEKIENVFNTNIYSSLKLTQLAIDKMILKKYGRIIFISSLAGKLSIPFLSPYCASKSALNTFVTSLRYEMKILKHLDIQVCSIEPGAYFTGFNQKNISKKFNWMHEKSYFKNIDEIQNIEKKIWSIIEKKKLYSIVRQYIRAVEDVRVKHLYTAPKSQAFLTILLGR